MTDTPDSNPLARKLAAHQAAVNARSQQASQAPERALSEEGPGSDPLYAGAEHSGPGSQVNDGEDEFPAPAQLAACRTRPRSPGGMSTLAAVAKREAKRLRLDDCDTQALQTFAEVVFVLHVLRFLLRTDRCDLSDRRPLASKMSSSGLLSWHRTRS